MKLLALALTFALGSCSGLKKDPADKKEDKKDPQALLESQKIIIGRIASVSQANNFVLIQKFGKGALPKGYAFQSRGDDGRTASLQPSGERIRDFYAADLVSGSAQKGDAVLAYPIPPEQPDQTDQSDQTDQPDPEI